MIMQLFAIALTMFIAPAYACAGVYYYCIDPDRKDVVILVDFENQEITSSYISNKQLINGERLTDVDPDFEYVGKSLIQSRSAKVSGGKVEIRKLGSVTYGSMVGHLTFKKQWDFNCSEERD